MHSTLSQIHFYGSLALQQEFGFLGPRQECVVSYEGKLVLGFKGHLNSQWSPVTPLICPSLLDREISFQK